jgi:hypothetical protein
MNNIAHSLEEQIMKRMVLDNPWWISNTIPEYYSGSSEISRDAVVM